MVGREGEFATLARLLDETATGHAAAVLVAGEAGIGKTRLVSEFAAEARSRGSRVVAGGCMELGDGVLPYAPLVEALRALARGVDPAALPELIGTARAELRRLVPDVIAPPAGDVTGDSTGDGIGGGSSQGRLFELVLDVLARASENDPLVLVFEDLHWADRATRDLVRYVVHNLDSAGRLLFVGTYRSDELHRRHPLLPLLAELERDGRVERVGLDRLNRAETATLLFQILSEGPGDDLVSAIHDRSEGNPFFAEELLAARATKLPDTLRDVLVARLAALGAPAQRLVPIVAAAGRPVSHGLLAQVVRLAEPALLTALRDAVDRGVLVVDTELERYRFRHALLAEAAYAELLPGERTRTHQSYAAALTGRPDLRDRSPAGAAAELAHHLDLAGDRGAALPARVEAGRAAEGVYAYGEALRQYERALSLWEQVDDAEARTGRPVDWVFSQAAEAAIYHGETARGLALAQGAVDHIDAHAQPARAAMATARLARFWKLNGDSGRAIEIGFRAVRLVPADPPTAARSEALGTVGFELAVIGRFDEAVRLCREAVQVAKAANARTQEGRALMALGVALTGLGDFDAGVDYLRAAERIATETGDRETQDRIANNLVWPLHIVGRLDEAFETARRGVDVARRAGSIGWASIQVNGAFCALLLGRWDEAHALLKEVIDLPRLGIWGIVSRLVGSELAVARGAFDEAEALLDDAHALYPTVRAPGGGAPHEMMARLALWRGLADESTRLIHEAIEALPEPVANIDVRELCWLGLWAAADRAQNAAARKEATALAQARTDADELIALFRRHRAHIGQVARTPDAHLAADAAQAEAEYGRAVGTAEPEDWASAAGAWDALAHPYEAACARWREAEAMLSAKVSHGRAEVPLRAAYATAVQLGAAPLSRELASLARRARIDLESESPPATPVVPLPADIHGLTSREREVLKLLAGGATDRQIAATLFITEKTANTHVANIRGKLGAANRVEAATIAHRLGLVG
jgi:DNA-binding CsgD family transcriptional regulator/tetratricopeptide (TPR) repeat protein